MRLPFARYPFSLRKNRQSTEDPSERGPGDQSACSNKLLTVLERTVRLAPFRARPFHPFSVVFMNDGNRSRLR